MDRSLFIVASQSRGEAPAVGITVMNNVLVIVSVRTEPLRITGIYRHDLSSTDMSPDAHDKRLRKALRRGRRALCLSRGADATVALQPQDRRITLRLDQRSGQTVSVRCRPSLPRLLTQAGFTSDSFDVLPVAFARAMLCGPGDRVSLHHRSGWTVQVSDDVFEASWSRGQTTRHPAAQRNVAESAILSGLHIPSKLRRILDVDLDVGAIGAALCGCGLAPSIGRETIPHVIDLRDAEGWTSPAIDSRPA